MRTVKGWQEAKTDKQSGVVCQKVQGSGERLEDGRRTVLVQFADL
jgi:hypothetical protein